MSEAPPTAVLRLEGLTVRLPPGADRPHAIEDIALEVHPREILCVVGESGSGKSVTAFTVMGLLGRTQLKPVAGRVLLQGEDLLQASPARLRDLRGSRTSRITSRTRRSRACASNLVWMRSTSSICSPTRITGLSAVIGSWKIIDMRVQRSSRSRSSEACSRSSPPSRTRPATGWSCLRGSSPITV